MSPNRSGTPGPIPDEFVEPLARAVDRLGVFSHRQFLWYADVPSTNDLASPFGKLYTNVHDAVDMTKEGSLVNHMNEGAKLLGIPGFTAE